MSIHRFEEDTIKFFMPDVPVVGIIGARQVGKTTLAKSLLTNFNDVVFLDLEKKSDRQIIENTEEFLNLNKGKVVCIDEIQMMPDVLSEMRNFVDNNDDTKFILLGSSSPDIMRKSAESLAGRIFYFELQSFLWQEIKGKTTMQNYRLLGGMPKSILAKNKQLAFVWLKNYIRTFLERDLRNFGFNIPPDTLHRLWQMLAHLNGQILNSSQLANSMGMSHTTIKNYIDILANTFMLRLLQPYHTNIKKRLVKSPKIYFRDTGVLHALLNIQSYNELFVHPVYGSSWEVTVTENLIAKYRGWDYYFYRTATGNEIDLVFTKANKIVAIEIKSSNTPKLTKGFWYALDDIKADEAYVIAPVRMPYPLKNGVMVYPLEDFLEKNIDE